MGSNDARSMRARYTSSCRAASARYSCKQAQAYASAAGAPASRHALAPMRVTDRVTVGRCRTQGAGERGCEMLLSLSLKGRISGNHLKDLVSGAFPRCLVRLSA